MIVLVGATGITGQIIAFKLQSLPVPFRLAGRSKAKLEKLADKLHKPVEIIPVDVTAPATISPALQGARVVINCAGPFTDLGEPVVKAALENNLHYVDTTGEQAFIRLVYEKYSSAARSRNIALVPACAFEYALADALACLVERSLDTVDSIEFFYRVSGFNASRGTKKSIIRALTADGFCRKNNRLTAMAIGNESKTVRIDDTTLHAFSFPGGETFMLPLHMDVRDINSYLALPLHPAVFVPLAALFSRILEGKTGDFLSRRIDTGSAGPSEKSRLNSRFTILCRGNNNFQSSEASVEGCDPYGLTGVIAAHVANALAEGRTGHTGAVSPTMVAGAGLVMKATENAGLTWSGPSS